MKKHLLCDKNIRVLEEFKNGASVRKLTKIVTARTAESHILKLLEADLLYIDKQVRPKIYKLTDNGIKLLDALKNILELIKNERK